ncbi:two-component response regulator ARR2-like isoform X2 [Macadamia integrifolia]|uniref:two-component response regulator ARR2-like isoform X2 n=1 Tax=Macadamia integrifolia TaxID=60698 RepID=UPI001C4E360A|nr:two-component response regulator ARR2-like isoform X2 [Macadamia integrifolia]
MESKNVNGFSAGLSVLVVDYDHKSLQNVERMLQECNYKVVAVDHAVAALAIIRDRRGEFDAVLMDLHMPPEGDGLELLKYIKHEFNLPVIMMSTDDKDEADAEICLHNGAYFFWKKPLSMRNIRYHLWKFIFMYKNAKTRALKMKRKMHGLRKSSSMSKSNGSMSPIAIKSISGRKRNAPRMRRPKINWTEELHSKFLKAIEIVGFQNAVPSNILELMKEPRLSRSQISSHLQVSHLLVITMNKDQVLVTKSNNVFIPEESNKI